MRRRYSNGSESPPELRSPRPLCQPGGSRRGSVNSEDTCSETEALTSATVILDTENTVQPDALLRRLPEHGGLSRVNEDGYLAGPPELIVEVAASSASIDLRDKRRACCRNGVREYLVWLVAEARLEWFCLEDDDYRPQLPDEQGVLHSRVFPGLRLPVAPLLAGET